MKPKRIYLIRHGQSKTQSGELPESEKDAPLSRMGERQARQLRSIRFARIPDWILVSTMQRAHQTFQLSQIRAPIMQFDSRLIESDWGMRIFYRGAIYEASDSLLEKDGQGAILLPVITRAQSLCREVLASPHECVVLFGHWGVFGHFFHAFFGMSRRKGIGLNASSNAAISLLEVDESGDRRLVYWNQTGHLADRDAPI